MLNYIIVFFAVILVDIAWTYYLIKVQDRKAIQSGLWAAIIYLLGAYVVVLYNEHHSYIYVATIASFIGTASTVKYKKIHEKDPKYFINKFRSIWKKK